MRTQAERDRVKKLAKKVEADWLAAQKRADRIMTSAAKAVAEFEKAEKRAA